MAAGNVEGHTAATTGLSHVPGMRKWVGAAEVLYTRRGLCFSGSSPFDVQDPLFFPHIPLQFSSPGAKKTAHHFCRQGNASIRVCSLCSLFITPALLGTGLVLLPSIILRKRLV